MARNENAAIALARRRVMNNTTQARESTRLARLGNGSGRLDTDEIGYHWARFPKGIDENGNAVFGEPFKVLANPGGGYVPANNRDVELERFGNEWIVKRGSPKDMIAAGIDPRAGNTLDPYTKFRYLDELVNLNAYPIGSGLLVQIREWNYRTDNNIVKVYRGTTPTTHLNLATYRPVAANTQLWAVVVFNITQHLAAADPIEVYVSPAITTLGAVLDETDLQDAYDTFPVDEVIVPIKAFKLENGQTTHRGPDYELDVRQAWNIPNLSGMSSFDVAADTGTPGTLGNGDTLTIAGTGGIATSVTGTTVTIDGSGISSGITELTGDVTAGPGSGSVAATIANNAVTQTKILDGAVTTSKINDTAVTNAKLASDAVTQAKIADNAVGTNEIINANVTTPKLADGAVTTDKIADNAVTGAKIIETSVGLVHLAFDVVYGDIVDPTVNDDSLAGFGLFSQWINILTRDVFDLVDSEAGAAVWINRRSSIPVNIQRFVTPGSATWTKPANARMVRVICVGAGGGGGSGRRDTTAVRGGGGGGAAGYVTEMEYAADQLGSTESVFVGTGGTGGTAVAAATNGNAGGAGGDSFFGGTSIATAIQMAQGGLGGAGGTTANVAGGVGATTWGPSVQFYGANGGVGTGGITSPIGNSSSYGPGSGGGGAALAGTGGAGGAASGKNKKAFGAPTQTGGGGAAGAPGTAGAGGHATGLGGVWFGEGGGGGNGTAAGAGGNGGTPGGGGGGAGGTSSAGGAGGAGGNGGVIVITYF